MNKPLTWGLTTEQIKKQFKTSRVFGESVTIRGKYGEFGGVLVNFPGDCGALLMKGANYATKEGLKEVTRFASACGFSKIFATVVTEGVSEDLLNAYKANRWIKVYQGKSNRNSYKDDIVFVKIIRNCEWKGYGGKGD